MGACGDEENTTKLTKDSSLHDNQSKEVASADYPVI